MRILLLFGFIVSRLACLADKYELEGEPYMPPTNALIVWKVAVTNLPTDLWIYQVCPQTFPSPVISNILTMSKVEMKDLIKSDKQSLDFDANFQRFLVKNKKGTMLYQLEIAPTRGWITYEGPLGNGTDPLEIAPTVEEVKQLGLKCAFQIGIDRSLIDSKPRSMSVSTTQRGSLPEMITGRGVFYSRKIDGIDERGFGFTANFGTHNGNPQLLSFTLNWRNLVPYKPCSVATTNEIIDFIKSGRATTPPQPVELNVLKNAKKLMITQCTPIYFSKPGMYNVSFEYPYLEMTVVADYGDTNTTTFYLNCPIFR